MAASPVGIRLLALACIAAPASAQAEVRGFMEYCAMGKLCPWFQPVLSVPPGWVEDKRMSSKNKLLFLVPRGKTSTSATVRMYGKVFVNAENISVDQRVRVDGEQWKQVSPRATYERLPDVPRSNGKGVFQLYRYRNPDRAEQPVEMTAFGEDRDDHGTNFGVLIVLTATSEAELGRSEPAYRSLLTTY